MKIIFVSLALLLFDASLKQLQASNLTNDNTHLLAMVPADNHEDIVPLPELDDENWLDRTELYLSDVIHDFSSYLDHNLAKEEDEEPLVNKSYIKLRFKTQYTHRGYYKANERISARIDLPHVENNWKFILETDPDDYESLESKQRDLPVENRGKLSDSAIGGVRLQDEQFRNWKTSFDLGIKLRFPIDPFTRARMRRVEDLSEEWTTQFKQELFYYDSIGSGALTELNFYHAVNPEVTDIIKLSTSGQYLYDDRGWELLAQFSYFDRVHNDHLLEYAIGVSVEPHEIEEVSNSWISLSWSQRVYDDWLYFSVTPQVDAPREFDYKLNPGLQLELEAFFSKNSNRDHLKRVIPSSTRVRE